MSQWPSQSRPRPLVLGVYVAFSNSTTLGFPAMAGHSRAHTEFCLVPRIPSDDLANGQITLTQCSPNIYRNRNCPFPLNRGCLGHRLCASFPDPYSHDSCGASRSRRRPAQRPTTLPDVGRNMGYKEGGTTHGGAIQDPWNPASCLRRGRPRGKDKKREACPGPPSLVARRGDAYDTAKMLG